MIRNLLAIWLLCMSLTSAAQRSLRGRVVNESGGAAIPGCTIFIANTSIRTTSDEQGQFLLSGIPAGQHELIITSVGFHTNVFSFREDQLPMQVKVELRVKVEELPNVTLEEYVEEGWSRWGKVFSDNFIGSSETSGQCNIKNEKAIRFRYYKRSNRLIAYCDEPVLMENRALGYTVSFQLENFEVRFNERVSTFLGYPLYIPMEKNEADLSKKWSKARLKAYQGSIMHFMRSLFNNRLLEEGFEVRRMVRSPNTEKIRVGAIYRAAHASGKSVTDSSKYYSQVMRQQDFYETYSRALLNADSLVVETTGDFRAVQFPDYLYITFTKEDEEKAYVARQWPARPAGPQRSYVTLLNDKFIVLDGNGNYFSPQDFLTSGYWGYTEKMCNSLPLDYQPPSNK